MKTLQNIIEDEIGRLSDEDKRRFALTIKRAYLKGELTSGDMRAARRLLGTAMDVKAP